MSNYNKKQIGMCLNSDLTIYWWNFGKKTLDFKGSVNEYLKREGIKYKTNFYVNAELELDLYKIKSKIVLGSMEFSIVSKDIYDFVRMCINIRLTYLGDRACFLFDGRFRTINK